jgi:hypothetical protein
MNNEEWNKAWELFHNLWGQCKDKVYNKEKWDELRVLLAKGKQNANDIKS